MVNEAPPMVSSIELTRHVRSARGAAFYHKSIGTLLTGDDSQKQYMDQKAKNDAAKQALQQVKAEKRVTSSHSDLLAARRAARAKHPVGHPERLAAERAVRASRRSTSFKDASRNAKQAQAPADKKSTTTTDKRKFLVTGGASTSAATTGVGGSFSPKATTAPPPRDQVAKRLQELNNLTSGERSQYFALRNAGLQHARAMKQIHERQSRPKPATKVVQAVKRRRTRR